jgi:hypothetical protein
MIVVAAVLALVSCSRDIQNTEAVKQGVVDYLKGRSSQLGLNIDAMKIDVTSVSFRAGNEAHATVLFSPKGMEGAGGMTMSATLDKKGSRWVVRGHLESGGANPHGAGGLPPNPSDGQGASPSPGALPPGHPPIGGSSPSSGASPGGALPPGHPPIGSGGSPSSGSSGAALPPGHPPIGSKQ